MERSGVHTAIWKAPVSGCCRVGRLNLEGDGQGDLAGHGGEQPEAPIIAPSSKHRGRGRASVPFSASLIKYLDVSEWSSNAAVTYRLEPLRS
jgi:hypothetical protein